MLRNLRVRLTYANVMATIAVFGVLAGGVAWALERNSVRSKHVVNGSLRLQDIAVGQATRTFDVGDLIGNQCQTNDFGGAAFSDVKPGDWTIVIPEGTPNPIIAYGFRTSEAGEAKAAFCNTAEGSIDPGPHDYKLIVVRR